MTSEEAYPRLYIKCSLEIAEPLIQFDQKMSSLAIVSKVDVITLKYLMNVPDVINDTALNMTSLYASIINLSQKLKINERAGTFIRYLRVYAIYACNHDDVTTRQMASPSACRTC